ncbi:MAG: bifunctional methylenetetrahydrofolate dehydrogenase/methenyltetrahydrofolate cyclohydrolase [Mycoplasmataceae bacterium]|jgi:methylenetetrahydrofolate dehydrogenase (NADP+)/methenyltetrahydrofolate cyclohydrolase|nr:bifunctional methylenetetrahydrofolate dehydrogenase/methenyltetrahydrofolate cyclohydrolase [Mycoplasmataceae bacterium]
MTIIDGKKIANDIINELKQEVDQLNHSHIVPTLVIVQIGDEYASNVYIKNKLKLAQSLNIRAELKHFPSTINDQDLINTIQQLNNDHNVNGILVQMPLPKHINEANVIEHIAPHKDVDCFHLINIGKLWTARKSEVKLKPCTPAGIVQLLKRSHIDIEGKETVIVGRSNIVGKPLASLLLLDNATVTLCHSLTKELRSVCKKADILISAIGKAKIIDETYIKPGAVIIDVGVNRDVHNHICGDVDFAKIKDIPGYVTPVPGGVGPMTVVMLMQNLITLTKIQHHIQ